MKRILVALTMLVVGCGVTGGDDSGAAMARDSATGMTYKFGGRLDGQLVNALWSWDGTSWHQLQSIVSPPPREDATMAFDPVRRVVVLFGGSADAGFACDTWTMDPATATWTERATSDHPACRSSAELLFKADRGDALLSGGVNNAGELHDAWLWNGSEWIAIAYGSS